MHITLDQAMSLRKHINRATIWSTEPTFHGTRSSPPGPSGPANGATGKAATKVPIALVTAFLAAMTVQETGCASHKLNKSSEGSKNRDGRVKARNGRTSSQTIDISILDCLAGKRTGREMRFYRGETLDCTLQVSGFDAPGGRLHLRSMMTMSLPKTGVLWKEGPRDLVDQPIPKGRSRKTIRLKLGLRLSTAEPAGRHRLLLRVDEPESQRYGTAAVEFEVKGPRLRRFSQLTITRLDVPDPLDLRPGGTVHLSLWVGGLRSHVQGNGRHTLRLAGTVTWRPTGDPSPGASADETSGRPLETSRFAVSFDDMRFVPAQVPLRPRIRVPGKVGRYDLSVTIWQKRAEGTTAQGKTTVPESKRKGPVVRRTVHGLTVQPAGLGIYDMAILGPGDSPIHRFYRGQTLNVVFQIWGPRQTELVGDLAVEGPDGGIFFLKKGAFRIAPTGATGKRELNRNIIVPMELPRYCPLGRYRLLVRLRSLDGRISASRHILFIVEGRRLPRLPKLQITDWFLGSRPMLLPRLVQGAQVPIQVVVGGMHMEKIPPVGHRIDLVFNLLVRRPDGTLLSKIPQVAQVSRTFTFAPRRVPLTGTWRVPGDISGLVLLQVEAEDLLTHQVSISQKKIFIAPK